MRAAVPAILVFCCCLGFSALCLALEITDCGSKDGKFTNIVLTGCDMSKDTCELVRNTNASIEIDFSVEKDLAKVTAHVHGIIMDVPIPFPLSKAEACEDEQSGLKCPLTKGSSYSYKHTLPVLKSYPKLAVGVKWQLTDENNDDVVCVLFPARIK